MCNHTSVGILVWKDNKLLLIERKNFPFGFAPPAGHLDSDSYEEAAKRELKEEVGLEATDLKLLYEGKAENICRREGDGWHYWKIYEATVKGRVNRSLDETKRVGWYSREEIKNLANKTKAYLEGRIGENKWQESPGIETIWLDWFNKLKIT